VPRAARNCWLSTCALDSPMCTDWRKRVALASSLPPYTGIEHAPKLGVRGAQKRSHYRRDRRGPGSYKDIRLSSTATATACHPATSAPNSPSKPILPRSPSTIGTRKWPRLHTPGNADRP
jgi:hypothetical protein